jgi:hypothetical protein
MDAFEAFSDVKALDMSVDSSMAFQSGEADLDVTADIQFDYKIISSGDDVQLQYTATVTSEDETHTVSMWYADGYLYTDSDDVKSKTAVDASGASDLIVAQGNDMEIPESPLCLIDSITATETADGTLYSIVFSSDFGDTEQADQALTSLFGLSLDHYDMQVLVGDDGMISSVHESFAFTMTATSEGETASISFSYEIDMTVNAVNDDVTIEFPDLSAFTEYQYY